MDWDVQDVQPQGLPDDRVEVLETVKLLVVQIPVAIPRCANFIAEPGLHVGMLS